MNTDWNNYCTNMVSPLMVGICISIPGQCANILQKEIVGALKLQLFYASGAIAHVMLRLYDCGVGDLVRSSFSFQSPLVASTTIWPMYRVGKWNGMEISSSSPKMDIPILSVMHRRIY
jgi:hypothetical protein